MACVQNSLITACNSRRAKVMFSGIGILGGGLGLLYPPPDVYLIPHGTDIYWWSQAGSMLECLLLTSSYVW